MRSVKEIMRASAELNSEGVHVGGSDRESNHSYGDAYEALFTYARPQDDPSDVVALEYPRSGREDVRLMLEVGVADGSSLIAWSEVFPNATVVGMDIHPAARVADAAVPIEFHIGDQRSLEDCRRVAAGREFDLIVEDATHLLEDTLRTLLYLWPHVRPGGMYVVEEFPDVGSLRGNIAALWPFAEIVDTFGPFGGVEPLVMLRRPK